MMSYENIKLNSKNMRNCNVIKLFEYKFYENDWFKTSLALTSMPFWDNNNSVICMFPFWAAIISGVLLTGWVKYYKCF